MKARTNREQALLDSGAGYATHLRVWVANASGTLVNLGDVDGRDFLNSAAWNYSLEAYVAQATVELALQVNGVSLAPYCTTSPANDPDVLLAHWRLLVIEVAVAPLNWPLASVDNSWWLEGFRGYVQRVNVGEDSITVDALCLGQRLQRNQVEYFDRTYGSTSGVAMQTVMGQILVDNFVTDVTVTTPVSPAALVGPYVQKKQSLMEALRSLAQRIGWEVRYMRNPSTGQYTELRFYEPDRAKTTADYTFSPSEYRMLSELTEDGIDVRNIIDVWYTDTADRDAAGNPKRKSVTAFDATSYTLYGRARMQVAEDASSEINTAVEATRLANAALADLKDPKVTGQAEVDCFPWADLQDLIGLEANGTTHSSTLTLHVTKVEHKVAHDSATTRFYFRGDKPFSSRSAWLERDAGKKDTPKAAPNLGPQQPTSMAATPTAAGFTLSFLPPVSGAKPDTYELHLSTSSGFTPSSSTQRGTTATNAFDVTGLTPGTTYYAVVVPRDAMGNAGTTSAEVSFTARYVEPRTLQPRVTYAAVPLNADFEAANAAGEPPDGWDVLVGTWGVEFTLTNDANSGTNAVQLGPTNTSEPEIASQLFVVYPDTRYAMRCRFKSSLSATPATLATYPTIGLRWYSDTTTIVSSSERSATTTTANAWGTIESVETAPSTAKFARIVLTATLNSAAQTIVYDSVAVDVATIPLTDTTLPALLNSFTDAADANVGKAQHYVDANGRVCLMGAVSRTTTAPSAGTVIFTLPTGRRPSRKRQFAVSTDTGHGACRIETNGDVTYQSGGYAEFFLDGIIFRTDDTA